MDLESVQKNMTKVVIPGGDPSGFYIYRPTTDVHSTVLYSDGIPQTFFDSQTKFIETLSEEEKQILASYSFIGDEVINKVLRNTENPDELMALVEKFKKSGSDYNFFKVPLDLIKPRNVMRFSREYVDRFNKVFSKVPVLDVPIKVFRGTRDFRNSLEGYISTTYYPFFTVAVKNQFVGDTCCIYECKLQTGVRALWLEPISTSPHEREILIEPAILNASQPIKKKVIFIPGPSNRIQSVRDVDVYECTLSKRTGGRRLKTKRSKRKARKTQKK